MPAGDPLFVCPFCGKSAYYATGCSCGAWINQASKQCHCVEQQVIPDYEYCSECGEPTLHDAFGAPLCEECLNKQETEDCKTLVVNLLGGPGCGKSTIRAGVFFELKLKGIDCEEAAEYAKDLTWAKSQFTLQNQIHVFGEQHNRIFRLLGQVQVIITDSPLLLTPIYDKRTNDTLRKLALEEYYSMWNYTVLLTREKPYNQNGRSQSEEGAREIDIKIADFLLDNKIPFEVASGNLDGRDKIVQKVMMLLNKNTH